MSTSRKNSVGSNDRDHGKSCDTLHDGGDTHNLSEMAIDQNKPTDQIGSASNTTSPHAALIQACTKDVAIRKETMDARKLSDLPSLSNSIANDFGQPPVTERQTDKSRHNFLQKEANSQNRRNDDSFKATHKYKNVKIMLFSGAAHEDLDGWIDRLRTLGS